VPSARLIAGGLVALVVVFVVVSNGIELYLGEWHEPSGYLVVLVFAVAGGLLASRRPDNRVGWLFLACAVATGWLAAANQYARLAMTDIDPPGALVVGVLGVWGWIGGSAAVVLAVLHLPDGRLRSRRWRLAVGATVAGALLIGVSEMFASWEAHGYPAENPFHDPTLDPLLGGLFEAGAVLMFIAVGAALVQLGLRFRGSSGDERQQLKWIVAGGVAAFVITVTNDYTTRLPGVTHAAVGAIAVSAIPVSVGVAVLRYRLYEFDRVVSRTASYLVLTGLLVGTYILAALGIGVLIRTLTGGQEGDLAVAGSTLIVAALFRPLRSRVQTAVDRRFHRARFDAQTTLDSLAARLRNEVAIDALVEDLRRTTADAVRPRHVSLWVREGAAAHAER
jgi:hypothetical protein